MVMEQMQQLSNYEEKVKIGTHCPQAVVETKFYNQFPHCTEETTWPKPQKNFNIFGIVGIDAKILVT